MKKWLDNYQKGGKIKSVESENDPEYRAYQDSLTVYNGNKYLENYYNNNIKPMIGKKPMEELYKKYYKEINGKFIDNADLAMERLEKRNGKPYNLQKPSTAGELYFGIQKATYPKNKVVVNKSTPKSSSYKEPIYVDSKNDPRYKAYQDSLYLYNFQNKLGGKASKWLESVPRTKKGMVSEKNWEDYSNKALTLTTKKDLEKQWEAFNNLKKLNKKEPGKKYHFKQEMKLIPGGFNTYVSDFEKPKQPVFLKKAEIPDLPRVTSLNLPDLKIDSPRLNIPQSLVETKLPESYTINYNARNLLGGQMPIESTFLNNREASSDELKKIIQRKNNYNSYIEQKYGNEEASKNPKAVERLKKLKQSIEVKENYKNGGIITDELGQWAHPGEITSIPASNITMKGVDYPVLGISNTGDIKMMLPDNDYQFIGDSVTELPLNQVNKNNLANKSKNSNFTKKSNGWLSKYK